MLLAILQLTISSCNANSPKKKAIATTANPVGVTGALGALGINATPGVLNDQFGNPLPADYNPLGNKNTSIFSTKEIVVVGSRNGTTKAQILETASGTGGITPVALKTFNTASGWVVNTVKGGVAGDFDGDGFDEVALAYITLTGDIMLEVTDDKSGSYISLTSGFVKIGTTAYFSPDGNNASPGQMDLTVGDIDGDGKDELVIGAGVMAYNHNDITSYVVQQVIVLDDAANGFAPLTTLSLPLSASIHVTAGDTNLNGKAEIVVTTTENAQANYRIYSFANNILIQQGVAHLVTAVDLGVTYTAFNADVTIGDLNGNGVPEIIFGGVENFIITGRDSIYDIISVEYDQPTSGYIQTAPGKRIIDMFTGDCNSVNTVTIADAFVEILDIDGDRTMELLINNRVYDKTLTVRVDPANNPMNVFELANNRNCTLWTPDKYFDRSNTAIAVGDFNGDNKDDIIYWGRNRIDSIPIYGINNITGTFGLHILIYYSNVGEDSWPILIGANTDDDSLIVSYLRKEQTITEPVPIAALAAAPCWLDGSGQNVANSCSSSFGQGSSIGTVNENSQQVDASITVGAEAAAYFISKVALEFKATAAINSTWHQGVGYSTEKSITFTSGPNEDMVVYSAIPYDLYYYTVVSSPVATEIGVETVIRVPRKPIVLQAERSFYNAAVIGINPNRVIGSETFLHTPGNPLSYLGVGQVQGLLNGSNLLQGPNSVGQGTGFTTAEIVLNNEVSTGQSLGFSVTVDIQATVGPVIAGASIGYGGTTDITITHSQSSSYSGSVGAIDAANFAANQYSFGLFAYPQIAHPSGFQFHTVNYWVQ